MTFGKPKHAEEVEISLMGRNALALPAPNTGSQNYVWYLPYPKTQHELKKS